MGKPTASANAADGAPRVTATVAMTSDARGMAPCTTTGCAPNYAPIQADWPVRWRCVGGGRGATPARREEGVRHWNGGDQSGGAGRAVVLGGARGRAIRGGARD